MITDRFFGVRVVLVLSVFFGGLFSFSSARADTLLGEKPVQILKDAKQGRECYRFQRYTVVKTKDWFMIKQGGHPMLCHKGKARLYIKADEKYFRGIVKEYVLIARELGSDFFDLEIHSIRTKSIVWKRASLPPNASLSYDSVSGQLTFMAELKVPAACAKPFKPEQASEMLRACWGSVKQAYPSLKSAKMPVCKCEGGLVPYLTAGHSVYLGKPPFQTQISHHLKCGCAS